ncbi:Rhoa [Nucleospora cyclopteri]
MSDQDNVKIVVVGDGACGKTCFLEVFKSDKFPEEYVPTVVDNFVKNVKIDENTEVTLALWDTAGQEDYDTIRPLSYRGTDLIFLCYTVENKKNLENITSKWLVEIKNYCPEAPFYLVALKKDLRDEAVEQEVSYEIEEEFVTTKEGKEMAAKIKAMHFFECSALARENVDEIFISAAKDTLKTKKTQSQTRSGCCSCIFG